MSEENRVVLRIGQETEVSVSEAIAKLDEAIGLVEQCEGEDLGVVGEMRTVRKRLAALLGIMSACRTKMRAQPVEPEGK
jgi:hypothetical protein